jgi:hypothetical protein
MRPAYSRSTPVAIGLVATGASGARLPEIAQRQHGDVVGLGSPPDERCHLGADRPNHGVEHQTAASQQARQQAAGRELLAREITGFGDAVRVGEQPVAGFEQDEWRVSRNLV